MRALVLNIFLLLVGCSVSHAQFSDEVKETNDKRFFLGGSFNFDKSENRNSPTFINGLTVINGNITENESENSSYSINPSFGFQINKNWILGLDLLLFNRESESGDQPDNRQIQESSSNSVGLFARYILNPQDKFQVYASPYFRRTSQERFFSFGTNTLNQFDSEELSNNFGLSLGAQYQFTNWIRATTNIGGLYYTSGTTKTVNGTLEEFEIDFNSSGFNFRASSIFFGVEVLF